MSLSASYKYTKLACYIGYIAQAIVVNFTPLLFVTFNKDLGISLGQLTFLSGFTFIVQITVDLISARFADNIGYRRLIVLGQLFCAVGIGGYGIFPFIGIGVFSGLVISSFLAAIGGGIVEVLVSPIIEACPADSKSGSMAILHSFYCWGQAGVVLLSTMFFVLFGIENWRILAFVFCAVPLINAYLFFKVPIGRTVSESDSMSWKELFSSGVFRVLLVLMMSAGASELAISQWVSAFAEEGLHVSKAVGDIAGLCLFAVLMGAVRVVYNLFGKKTALVPLMLRCSVICFFGYLLSALAPYPIINLLGCALCGVSVGILWPGTLSVAAKLCKRGGTAMFALLALAGDIGCTFGTGLVGTVSSMFNEELEIGIMSAAVFPIVLIIGLSVIKNNMSDDLKAK